MSIFTFSSFATKVDVNNNSSIIVAPKNKYKISVAGDSYAGYFVKYLQFSGDILTEYALPQRTLEQNLPIMLNACKSLDPILVIAVGVNEYLYGIDPMTFKETYKLILDTATLYKKQVFTFTFMHFPKENNLSNSQYRISDYNDVIVELSNQYDIVRFIDMSMYETNEYIQGDMIHYNEKFYNKLYNNIKAYLNDGVNN